MHGYQVLAAREHMNSISDSVHASLKSQIRKYSMPGFDLQQTTINHSNGGSVVYRGLSRNPEGLKSIHAVHRCWVEEAQTISQESLEMLTPSIRAPGSEIWMTANPRSSKDPFSQRFLKPYEAELHSKGYYEDDMHLIIWCNYADNPWFPAELEAERQFDFKNKPRTTYDHIWLGAYDDTVEDAIISPEWFDACINAHTRLGWEPRGVTVVAHDPSDTGPDAKGVVRRCGMVIQDAQVRDTGDINQGADWAISYAQQHKPDSFIWDGDGMGVGLRRQFNEAFKPTKTDLRMFRGSEMPDRPDDVYEDGKDSPKTNKETFRNKRAQYYWQLRDRVYRTYQAVEKGKYVDPEEQISFSEDIGPLDLLRSEICRIPLKHNPAGLIQILTKPEMRARKIESPNMADAVMMSLANQPTHEDWGRSPSVDTSWVI